MNTDALLQASCDAAQDYLRQLNKRRLLPEARAVETLSHFEENFPKNGVDAGEVLRLLAEFGSGATTATSGGRFFGFVVGGTLPVTIASNWLSTAWDQNAGGWLLSPIAAKLEDVVATWPLEIFDLPRTAAVGFVTGSTMGAFAAIASARSATHA